MVATCELVNCAGVEVQCTGAVPTVAVDKCDGCQVSASLCRGFLLKKASELGPLLAWQQTVARSYCSGAVPMTGYAPACDVSFNRASEAGTPFVEPPAGGKPSYPICNLPPSLHVVLPLAALPAT